MSLLGLLKAPYLLFEYLEEFDSDGLKVVDYAPYDWFHYDEVLGQHYVTYMPPPYTTKKLKVLEALLKAQAPTQPGFLSYPIDVRGHAKTYEEAEERVGIIQTNRYAYTTGGETEGEAKSEKIKEQLKSKTQLSKQGALDLLKHVSSLDDLPTEEAHGNDSAFLPATSGVSDNRNLSEDQLQQISTSLESFAKTVTPLAVSRDEKKSGSNGSNQRSIDLKLKSNNRTNINSSSANYSKNQSSVSNDFKINNNYENINMPSTSSHGTKRQFEDPVQQGRKRKTTTGVFSSPGTQEISNNVTSSQQLQNLEFKMDQMMTIVKTTQVNVAEILNNQRIQNAQVPVPAQQLPMINFLEMYNLDMPFDEYDDFNAFDAKLATDENLKKDFICFISHFRDAQLKVRRTITNILRKCFSKQLAVQFVAMKAKDEKHVFKDTNMCKCMLASVTATHKEPATNMAVGEQYFLSELKCVLPNTKDWDGGRAQRTPAPNAA